MSKSILSLLAAALVCVAASSVLANEGTIASGTLSDMGLSALQVMSDGQAMEIRGLGYRGHRKPTQWASVAGKSWAKVELDGRHADDEGEAGSHNEYKAGGKYFAEGSNESHAALEVSDTLIVGYPDGTFASETKVRKISVSAGGASSARTF